MRALDLSLPTSMECASWLAHGTRDTITEVLDNAAAPWLCGAHARHPVTMLEKRTASHDAPKRQHRKLGKRDALL